MNQSERPVFVIGTGRCGTTLLANLLQGENFRCLKEMEVQSRLIEHDNKHMFNLLYTGEMSEEDFLRHFKKTRRLGERRGQRYAEKIPHGQWAMRQIRQVYPGALFIEIHRDGRDVVQSMLNVDWYAPFDTRPRWTPLPGEVEDWSSLSQLEKCCVRWLHTVRFTVQNIKKETPEDYFSVSYKELCRDTESVLCQIERFLDTTLFRNMVQIRLSADSWKRWTKIQQLTFYKTVGEEGRAHQRFLSYRKRHLHS
jgi:hypothetical protein